MSSSAFSSSVPSAFFPSSASSATSSSSPSSSSILNPSPTSISTSISTSAPILTPTIRHTASQSLSPSHIPADTPSSPIIQKATPIPGIPPPSSTSISVLTQLQNLLDITSTLLGLFFVSLLTILFIYWSTIYILHKTLGIQPSISKPHQKANSNETETQNQKKEVSFQSSPNSSSSHRESKYNKKAQEIKQRISNVQYSSSPSKSQSQTPPKNQEPTPIAGLGTKPLSEKETIAKIATSTDYEEMGEATGRNPEDIRADVDLEFQRGVADVRGDVDMDIDAVGRKGGGSVGIL